MLKKAARPIGRGSFGVVSLAISQPKDETRHNFPYFIAVKSAESCYQLRSLQKEWKLFNKLADCPHILRCYGTFVSSNENGGTLFNIMLEYASGGSLANQIRRSGGRGSGLFDYEVRWYAKSILLGLSHIHKQGYVHCDIKPHNILLVGGYGSLTSLRPRRKRVEEETLKIADFGSAKKAGKKGKGKRGWRGTPLYAAPESVLFQEYEPHSDVWAFGCTVLEMITGEPAWRCEPEAETCAVLYRIGFTRRVPEIPSWVTEEGKDFLRKCLVRDPESRWTADMLLGHPFVSARVQMLPPMESKRRESWSFQTKQED